MEAFKTLKLRIKDKHAALLRRMSRDVNMVWNFVNETSFKAARERCTWLSGYELQKMVAGFSKCDGVTIGSATGDIICQEYASRRRQFKRQKLHWRVSNRKSPKYSLGWVPFKAEAIRYRAGQLIYRGAKFSLWDSYGLSDYVLHAGSFSEDSRGRWYANITVEVPVVGCAGTSAIGIDLGLKTAVTTSDSRKFDGRQYRASEAKLTKAQRANKKRLARTVHAKIKNQRKDGLHKFSTALVMSNAAIFVGDVSSEKLLKTKMAKSVQDAGWAMFKTMLERKCHQAGVVFGVVDESYTTQTCNACGVIAGPKGRAGLNKRMWVCPSCGVEHDRDVNAALNIRARGLARLEEGAVS